jgi:hypothetical protein
MTVFQPRSAVVQVLLPSGITGVHKMRESGLIAKYLCDTKVGRRLLGCAGVSSDPTRSSVHSRGSSYDLNDYRLLDPNVKRSVRQLLTAELLGRAIHWNSFQSPERCALLGHSRAKLPPLCSGR